MAPNPLQQRWPRDDDRRHRFDRRTDPAQLRHHHGRRREQRRAQGRALCPEAHEQHGWRIIPVNPTAAGILGGDGVPALAEVPEQVGLVDVFGRPPIPRTSPGRPWRPARRHSATAGDRVGRVAGDRPGRRFALRRGPVPDHRATPTAARCAAQPVTRIAAIRRSGGSPTDAGRRSRADRHREGRNGENLRCESLAADLYPSRVRGRELTDQRVAGEEPSPLQVQSQFVTGRNSVADGSSSICNSTGCPVQGLPDRMGLNGPIGRRSRRIGAPMRGQQHAVRDQVVREAVGAVEPDFPAAAEFPHPGKEFDIVRAATEIHTDSTIGPTISVSCRSGG